MTQKVKLKSFNGSLSAPRDTQPEENYWLLIGSDGELVGEKNSRGRVLVKFETSVLSLGLACHNEVENALYILDSDLEHID
ncbi:hypothetical protein [Pseudomonas sp. OF001]|uniref:hypothetical protein n=1 Tax=Pseudomonas sp. OF001 TaxID=2772300 RepID=UPI00191A4C63|nr:hypothetical protein [Pseudomonas sp. OF001]